MTDVMLDIETIGPAPDGMMVSFAAVKFTDVVIETCSWQIEYDSQFKINADTVAWWMQQSETAKKASFSEDRVPVLQALTEFKEFAVDDEDVAGIWGYGSEFDNTILTNYFNAYGLKWSYRKNRCFRTLKGLYAARFCLDDLPPKEDMVEHDPVEDCLYQIKCFRYINEKLFGAAL